MSEEPSKSEHGKIVITSLELNDIAPSNSVQNGNNLDIQKNQAESPLLPTDSKNISPEQANINNNKNNEPILIAQSARRKSSNISCRRRSSIPILDGGQNNIITTTYTENHINNNNNNYRKNSINSVHNSIESFTIVDEESNKKNMETKYDAVGTITGQWGKWQLRTVLLIFLCKIPSSWFMACIIFTAPAPRHGEFYCKPPEPVMNHTKWIKVSHPEKEESDDHEFNIDFCNVYEDAQAHAHHYFHYESEKDEPRLWEEPNKNASVIPCNTFLHQADYNSLITQFDLVCSRDILVAVTQFFHLFGVLTGGILATQLLKHFSPRNVMMFGMLTQIFCDAFRLFVVHKCIQQEL